MAALDGAVFEAGFSLALMADLVVAAQSVAGFVMTKRLLVRSFEQDFASLLDAEAGAQAIALTSPYLQEAAARFVRKEPPPFSWPR